MNVSRCRFRIIEIVPSVVCELQIIFPALEIGKYFMRESPDPSREVKIVSLCDFARQLLVYQWIFMERTIDKMTEFRIR